MESREGTDSSAPSAQRNEGYETGPSEAATPPASSQQSRRSRLQGTVTTNACNECRRKRAKCDGNQPCGRCKARNRGTCIYEAPVRQSKGELRRELDSLQEQQRKVDLVLAGLNQPRVQDEVLARLQALHPLDSIAGWLKRTEQQPHQQQQYDASANGAIGYGNTCFSQLLPSSTANIHGGLGVGDSADSTLKPSVQPNFSTPSQAHHERSFLLDESSRYPDGLPEPARSRLANWSEIRQTNHIIGSPGEHPELSEAVSSLQESLIKQSTETWTTVTNDIELVKHILGLYFCWEYPTFASLSKEQFLRDFSQGRPRYCSSMLVNALLALGCRFSTFPKTRADPDDPQTSGQHFFDESLELLRRETDYHSLLMIQTLGILSIREASCGRTTDSIAYAGQSMRIAIEMGLHNIVENPQGAGVTDEFTVLSATYWGAFSLDQNFATWFDNVPTALRLGYNFTPAVLFSQPFIRLRIAGSELVPKDVCLQSASSIHTLLKCYAQLYTLRRTPTFLPHFILTSSITLLIIGILNARPGSNGSGTKVDQGIADDVKLGVDSLEEIAPCHHFAEQAANILRCLAVKWNVHTSIGPLPVITPDIYDRLVEPYFGRQTLFADDKLARSFVIGDEMRQVSEEESQQIKEAIIMMETLILQPVPVQGSSAFLKETNLAERGFIKI
ncbi:Nitrogen assimilation transcription factor nirA [Beauveria bassiana D1-5]|uniref:Nitrogen assimilation transcription factor nirA n=1 Tax=Beauveria bassiana D1-5 TaxID=1245745 RepID=A0A0A2VFF9_BEABA|nr:Nitrogen assimilation transcription factor nirA [Beauveria bassiana D1-5]